MTNKLFTLPEESDPFNELIFNKYRYIFVPDVT